MAFDRGEFSVGIFLDLSKAFDTSFISLSVRWKGAGGSLVLTFYPHLPLPEGDKSETCRDEIMGMIIMGMVNNVPEVNSWNSLVIRTSQNVSVPSETPLQESSTSIKCRNYYKLLVTHKHQNLKHCHNKVQTNYCLNSNLQVYNSTIKKWLMCSMQPSSYRCTFGTFAKHSRS